MMIRNLFSTRYITIGLGLAGLIFAIGYSNSNGEVKHLPPAQLSLPPSTPYQHTVSGTGLVEASSRNVEVGSFRAGIVAHLNVVEGQWVKKGELLFSLDNRVAAAELAEAKAAYEDAKDQMDRVRQLKTGTVVSEDKKLRIIYAAKRAEAALQAAQVAYDQMTVYAPVEGRILKTRIREGEFVDAGGQGAAPILMGNDQPFYLRVDIDENDVWRFDQKAEAQAVLRSNREIIFPLKFVRVEPYVQPKQSLSGEMTERVDTRVLQVIYEMDTTKNDIFIGQQLDVFIKASKG